MERGNWHGTSNLPCTISQSAVLLQNACSQSIHPLRFSSCAVFKEPKVWFRYWVMLKKGSFLYDVKIMAWIGDDDFFRKEYNEDYLFVSETITYNNIRGIRQVPINLSSFKNGDYEKLKDYKIVLMINGVNKDGTMFTNSKAYGFRTDVFNGCRFAEVQIDKNSETPSTNQEDGKRLMTSAFTIGWNPNL